MVACIIYSARGQVLHVAVSMMAGNVKNKARRWWLAHCFRNVQHHGWWLPQMLRMEVIAKSKSRLAVDSNCARIVRLHAGPCTCTAGLVARNGGMSFGGSCSYRLVPLKKTHTAKYAKSTRAQVAIMAARVPTTLDEWARECERFREVCGTRGMLNYEMMWLFRTAMIAEMRAHGIKNVAVGAADTVDLMRRCFPDQCGWLENAGGTSIKNVMRDWNYQGPAELFTMFLCILCTCTGMLGVDIQRAQQTIRKKRIELDEPGRCAHPAVIMDALLIETAH